MPDGEIVVVYEPEIVFVETSEQGPRGLSAYQTAVANGFIGTEKQWLQSLVGAPGIGGLVYEHQQPTAATTWTINHNFGRKAASVSLYSTGGALIIGEVTNINNNQSVASFDTPIPGYAIAT